MAMRDNIACLIEEFLEGTEHVWRVDSAEYKEHNRKYIAHENITEIVEWPGMLPDFADNVHLQTVRLQNR